MSQWYELLAIAGSITISDQEDQMIWMYEFSGVVLINFTGIKHIYLHVI
jgi:hypothetical protein